MKVKHISGELGTHSRKFLGKLRKYSYLRNILAVSPHVRPGLCERFRLVDLVYRLFKKKSSSVNLESILILGLGTS